MKVGNINPILFKNTPNITKPEQNTNDKKQTLELGNITPDFHVQTPQKYTKTGITELNNGLKIHNYKLANGHKISIVPMDGSPAIVKNYVNVGSMNETDNIKGISHFLEHMAFNGTNGENGHIKLNQGDSFKKIETLGGWVNASTNYSITDYITATPLLEDSDLEEQIKTLGAMTYDLALTKEMIEKEKGPVCSEINMILDNPVTIALDQTVRTLFNIKSSSDELVGGSVEHIKNLTQEDVKKYYDTYYTPDNMNLVITGDVDPEKTIALVAKSFNSKKSSKGQKHQTTLKPINKTIRKDFISDKTTSTSIVMGFAGPKSSDIKSKILFNVVQDYIFSAESGFRKSLRDYNASTYLDFEKISSEPNNPTFIYYSASCNEQNAEKVLKTIYNNLLEIAPPSKEFLNSAKEKAIEGFNKSLEYSNNTNEIIGRSNLYGTDKFYTEFENILNSITEKDVHNFIKEYLNPQKAAITLVHPTTTSYELNARYNEANNINFKGTRKPLSIEKTEVKTLDNNYTLATYQSKNKNITMFLNYSFNIEKHHFNPAAKMVLNLIYSNGTLHKTQDEFETLLDNKNLNIGANLYSQNLSYSLQCSPEKFKTAFNLFKEMKDSPRITQEEFDKNVSKIKDRLSRLEETAHSNYVDYESQNNKLFYSKKELLDGLETLTLKDVQDLHDYIQKNSQGVISVNIPEKNPDFKNTLLEELNSLEKTNLYEYQLKNIHTENLSPKVLSKAKEVSQADIMQIYKFKLENTIKEHLTLKLLDNILNSSHSIGLFNTLREKEHLAYSVFAETEKIENLGQLSCNILTTTDNKEIGEYSYDNVQKSINGFHRQINALINSEYTDEDIESAKKAIKASLLINEGIENKLSILETSLTSGHGIEYYNKLFTAIDSITREDIDNLAKHIFKNPPIYSVVASQDTLDANKDYFAKLEQI